MQFLVDVGTLVLFVVGSHASSKHISSTFFVKTLGGYVSVLSHINSPPYLESGSSSSASFSDNFISRGTGFSRSSISFSDNFIFLGTLLTLFSL